MGLDASAYAIKGDEKVEIFYWRKHYDLNALMFGFEIPEDDPMAWIDHESIPVIGLGFINVGLEELDTIEHFSQYFNYEEGLRHINSREKDLEFVSKAREMIKDGWRIDYYSC